MRAEGRTQNVMDWIGLVFSLIFLVFGLGILTGLFIGEQSVLTGGFRTVVGLVLAGYGIARGATTYSRIKRRGRSVDNE